MQFQSRIVELIYFRKTLFNLKDKGKCIVIGTLCYKGMRAWPFKGFHILIELEKSFFLVELGLKLNSKKEKKNFPFIILK